MSKQKDKESRQSLGSSFKNAWCGIWVAIKEERNFKIHLGVMLGVLLLGIMIKLTRMEWFICLILCAIVISAELMNCAIEAIVDLVTQERHPLAKRAKDTAAGGVLICALISALIGGCIFFPKMIELVLR